MFKRRVRTNRIFYIIILALTLSINCYLYSRIKNFDNLLNKQNMITESLLTVNNTLVTMVNHKDKYIRYKTMMDNIFKEDTEKGIKSITVLATTYNPVKEQCDNTPLIASDNKLVMPGIVAMPRKFRLKMNIRIGQVIMLDGLGTFIVRDNMNSRYKDMAKVDVISFIPKWTINEYRIMTWIGD